MGDLRHAIYIVLGKPEALALVDPLSITIKEQHVLAEMRKFSR